jgi:hypothetical protein
VRWEYLVLRFREDSYKHGEKEEWCWEMNGVKDQTIRDVPYWQVLNQLGAEGWELVWGNNRNSVLKKPMGQTATGAIGGPQN